MLKFDTRDKKPKLFDLLVLTALLAAVLAFLILNGAQKNATVIGVTLIVFYGIVLIRLITAFFGQLRYNPYSYNTIYYMGFALFLVFVIITTVLVTVRQARDPEMYRVHEILHVVLGSARNYMFVTSPFILVFSAALCFSNISLIRHEGRRLVNLLGILLSVLMIGGIVFLFFFDYYTSGSQFEVMMHDLVVNLFAAVYLYFECMLIGGMVAEAITARYQPPYDKDALIILGCGLRKDGTPTPLLRGRIDLALDFYRRQKAETGKELVFVTSGGQGPNEVIPESTSMKRYLIGQGIPAERILEEDRSNDTFHNMKYSKAVLQEHGVEGKIAFATTNYHVFRSGLYARRVKMRAVGMGAKTRWYFWPNASVREFVGLLTEHRGKQALIFGSMIVFYVVLTLIAYQI